jgi:hypothetical protein
MVAHHYKQVAEAGSEKHKLDMGARELVACQSSTLAGRERSGYVRFKVLWSALTSIHMQTIVP